MHPKEKKINELFFYWLIISLILVFFIIIVGGLTRLTNSGLSITEWELFKGLFPPLNKNSWELYFNEYKKIPQYELINSFMTLDEFKIIFYWEYFHRILARIIGIFFLFPLIYFYFSKEIKTEYLKLCYLVLTLIILQGVIGWYMVKSGLVNDVTVSHYRLSIHLFTAILIISIIFWLIRNIYTNKCKVFLNLNIENIPFLIFIFLIFAQIIVGAFVSGLDAGKIYQTWPKMGSSYIPNDLYFNNFMQVIELDNHSLVQFYHRNLAYIIIGYVLYLTIFIHKKKIKMLYRPFNVVLFILLVQIALGIFTLISGLNIYLASAHQIVSVMLVLSAINLYFLRSK